MSAKEQRERALPLIDRVAIAGVLLSRALGVSISRRATRVDASCKSPTVTADLPAIEGQVERKLRRNRSGSRARF